MFYQYRNYLFKNIPASVCKSCVTVIVSLIYIQGIQAQQLDIAQIQELCGKATAQQKQAAKAAGYDLDAICASLKSTQSSGEVLKTEQPVVSERPVISKEGIEQIEEEKNEELTKETLELKPFGYDLFAGAPTTFAPATLIPVPAEYMMGPGDEIRVQLFGKESQLYNLMVDRNGSIQFPKLGPISLTGLSFKEAKALLQQRIGKQILGVKASISLGELRSMQIFVLGDAYRPGAYTISSLSTMTNALFVSGGVNVIGSLRNIQLKRKGKVVAQLDLYDLLLKGDTSSDARLLPGDVIYIPPVGDTVAIDGAVKRPGIYELKKESKVSELLKLAGGYRSTAFAKASHLTRINEEGFINVIDLDLTQVTNKQFTLKPGDTLQVGERLEIKKNIVSVSGHVFRAREMAWRQGLRISDLIPSINVLKPGPQLNSALLIREESPLKNIYIEFVDLEKVLLNKKQSGDFLLQPQDQLIVLGFNEDREVLLETLIERLSRQAHAGRHSLTVNISGMVRYPGVYPLTKDMSVEQLIQLAGGLAESAYTLTGEVTRISMLDPNKASVEHYDIVLSYHSIDEKFLKSQNKSLLNHQKINKEQLIAHEFKLSSHDVVNIRQRPEYQDFASIEIIGEVKFPGQYRIRKGESFKDLIQRVGGFTDFAHIDAVVFTREELKEREQKRLEELRERLKSDIANSQLEQTNVGKNANLASLEQLSDSLDTAQALGRLVVDVQAVLDNKSEDVILKEGDRILVPAFRQEVSVVGEVQHPASHLYDPYLNFEEYVARSGGETEKADDERIYIVKADGSVVLPYKSGWVNALGIKIEPGDTIVVPLDVDAVNDLALWSQVSQILYQLALGAAAINSF